MKKRNQKLLSLFLSAMMVVGVVPSTVYAAPEQATEIAVEQEAGTEATNEDTVINENEADASADQAQENTDEAQAEDTAQENEAAAEEAEAQSEDEKSETPVYTIGNLDIKFDGANAAVAEALTKDAKIDETDPTIQQLRKELEEVKVKGGEAGASNNEANINTADLYDDEAEGQAEAIRSVQKATAEGIEYIKNAGADDVVLTLKSLEAFAKAADGKATKIIIHSEIQGIAGLTKTIAEVARTETSVAKEKEVK